MAASPYYSLLVIRANVVSKVFLKLKELVSLCLTFQNRNLRLVFDLALLFSVVISASMTTCYNCWYLNDLAITHLKCRASFLRQY